MTCPKCAGPMKEKTDPDVGRIGYCDRCGPKFVPPFTPERIAKARGLPIVK